MRVQLWKQEIWSSLIFLLPWLSPRVRALLAVREFWRFAIPLMKETDCSKSWFSQINSRFLIFGTATSVQFSRSVMSDSLQPHESQHTRPPCPSPTPEVYPNSCPSGRWCHPAIWSSIVPFSSCPQSLPASESFPTSQLLSLQHLTMKNYFNLLNTRGLREQSFASCPVSQDLIKVTEHE